MCLVPAWSAAVTDLLASLTGASAHCAVHSCSAAVTDLLAILTGASAHCEMLYSPLLVARHVLPATACDMATDFTLEDCCGQHESGLWGASQCLCKAPTRTQCVRLVDQAPYGATVLRCHDQQPQSSDWPLSQLALPACSAVLVHAAHICCSTLTHLRAVLAPTCSMLRSQMPLP